jgi:aminoglycoside phosphotransferase (APT) family kinase protein
VLGDTGAVLIHNDYKFDNLMLDPDNISNIVGVLDWEMSTIGDPLADLGTSLAYWIEPGDNDRSVVQCYLTLEPGAMTRRQIAECYADNTGRSIGNILYYYVLALLKLLVILQQIYFRYDQGLTQDERFAGMIGMVRQIAVKAVTAIEVGHI